ncbi:MAG: 3'-5' exonuclease [Saezia sp.]
MDIETTGLTAGYHEICSISWKFFTSHDWLLEDAEEVVYRHHLIKCFYPQIASEEALALNGETEESLVNENRHDFLDVWHEFTQEAEELYQSTPDCRAKIVLTGFNPEFDKSFLSQVVNLMGPGYMEGMFSHITDDLRMAAKGWLYSRGQWPVGDSADYISGLMGINPEPRPHVALGGVKQCAAMMRAMGWEKTKPKD